MQAMSISNGIIRIGFECLQFIPFRLLDIEGEHITNTFVLRRSILMKKKYTSHKNIFDRGRVFTCRKYLLCDRA